MKKNTNQFRQGDVLIVRRESIPKSAVKCSEAPILAHGEVTGHCHQVESHNDAEVFTDADDFGAARKFMRLKRDTGVIHQEHSRIHVSKGVIEVIRQVEYTPQAIRNVAD